MNEYLLDTSVLSRFSPEAPPLPAVLAEKLRREASRLFVPAVAIAEIQAGICKLERQGAHRKAARLNTWFQGLQVRFADRVVPLDREAALRTGEIADAASAVGRHPGFADVAIAGMARARDMAVLTENLRHFLPLGILSYDLAGMP